MPGDGAAAGREAARGLVEGFARLQAGIGCLEAASNTAVGLLEPALRGLVHDSLLDTGGDVPAPDVADLTRSQLVDELRLAAGMSRQAAADRVEFACAPTGRVAGMQQVLWSGMGAWWQVRRVVDQTTPLSDSTVNAIGHVVFAPGADGVSRASAATVRDRLRRCLARCTQQEADAARASLVPGVSAVCGDDGTGELVVVGDSARVAAGFDRCDRIARHLRSAGDRRSLGELRGLVALDLILYGTLHPHQQSLPMPLDAAPDDGDEADGVPPGFVLG